MQSPRITSRWYRGPLDHKSSFEKGHALVDVLAAVGSLGGAKSR